MFRLGLDAQAARQLHAADRDGGAAERDDLGVLKTERRSA
jgi:hypothetical protein